MINIGEISKPSVSESPVRPKRSTSEGELVVPADSVESPAKVSNSMVDKKNQKKKAKIVEKAVEKDSNEQHDNKLHDDDLYDESGHQEHHGQLDIKA